MQGAHSWPTGACRTRSACQRASAARPSLRLYGVQRHRITWLQAAPGGAAKIGSSSGGGARHARCLPPRSPLTFPHIEISLQHGRRVAAGRVRVERHLRDGGTGASSLGQQQGRGHFCAAPAGPSSAGRERHQLAPPQHRLQQLALHPHYNCPTSAMGYRLSSSRPLPRAPDWKWKEWGRAPPSAPACRSHSASRATHTCGPQAHSRGCQGGRVAAGAGMRGEHGARPAAAATSIGMAPCQPCGQRAGHRHGPHLLQRHHIRRALGAAGNARKWGSR